MHSKWLDAGISVSAFHYQSSRYDRIRPPAFGKYPEVNSLQMRHHEMMTPEELSSYLESTTKEDIWNDKNTSFRCRKRSSEANKTKKRRLGNNDDYIPNIRGSIGPGRGSSKVSTKFKPQTGSFCEKDASNYVERVDGGSKNTNKPSLFLQELAHLLSLLSAVALSTLRADAEGTESPLAGKLIFYVMCYIFNDLILYNFISSKRFCTRGTLASSRSRCVVCVEKARENAF